MCKFSLTVKQKSPFLAKFRWFLSETQPSCQQILGDLSRFLAEDMPEFLTRLRLENYTSEYCVERDIQRERERKLAEFCAKLSEFSENFGEFPLAQKCKAERSSLSPRHSLSSVFVAAFGPSAKFGVSRFARVVGELWAADPSRCRRGHEANAISGSHSGSRGTTTTWGQKTKTVSTSCINPAGLSLISDQFHRSGFSTIPYRTSFARYILSTKHKLGPRIVKFGFHTGRSMELLSFRFHLFATYIQICWHEVGCSPRTIRIHPARIARFWPLRPKDFISCLSFTTKVWKRGKRPPPSKQSSAKGLYLSILHRIALHEANLDL